MPPAPSSPSHAETNRRSERGQALHWACPLSTEDQLYQTVVALGDGMNAWIISRKP